MTEGLKTFWKFYDVIWPLCSNTHADPKLKEKWSKRCREATHEKDVLKICNNYSPNLSSLKEIQPLQPFHSGRKISLLFNDLVVTNGGDWIKAMAIGPFEIENATLGNCLEFLLQQGSNKTCILGCPSLNSRQFYHTR